METFYKVYYTVDECDDEFVICGDNLEEEFDRLDDAIKVMKKDNKKVERFNNITKENKTSHNYKIYSYTRKLEMYWNPKEVK